MAKNILAYIEDNIEDFLEEIIPEEVKWHVQFQIMNHPQAGPQPVVLLMITAPSGSLGQNLFSMGPIPLGLADDEGTLKAQIRDRWAEMQEQRAVVLQQISSTSIDTASKLILP